MKKTYLFLLLCLQWAMIQAQEVALPDTLEGDNIIRVLAIGNSFSQDAVEQYLYELAEEAGVKMIIGNAYRGGQGLQSHWIDVTEANNTFEYRKVQDGQRSNISHMALADIITDEPWQYITFQQVSQESGLTVTFEPYLTHLIQYTQGLQTNPNAVYGYHQTWAYSHDSTHSGFANYGNRQEVMYDSICFAVQYAMAMHPELSFVVPSGTAIQNARTTYLGDNMNRDGYHLDLKIGRYIAACTWLEAITGISSVGFSYSPDGVDFVTAHTCQVAAHNAVEHPFECTVLDYEGFRAVNDIVPTGLVKFNFGQERTTDPTWNDIMPATRTYTNILDTNMNPTAILMTFTGDFGGANKNGAPYTTTRMLMPSDVSQSALWGYATGKFGTQGPRGSATIRLSHLNPELTYELTIFSSRMGSQDFRQTSFIVQGEDTWADAIQSSNNSSETATIKGVRSTADGHVTLTVMPGAINTSPNSFYYLNAMTIKAHK
ncbi:MAG: DUF4886 domain-containing protein [Prevotellaceae bacterium]|nr:DUF4886 domain-containing protein [Prevotellaceae bacterium]